MKRTLAGIGILFAHLMLLSCASIQHYERLNQPTDIVLETHIGGSIFKLSRSSDLPNVFGKADIYGGKVDCGFLELRYQGMTDDGRLILRLTDIETQSTETTMIRYGTGWSSVNTTTTYSGYGAYTSGTITHIPPPEGATQMLPPNTTEFLFDIGKEKELSLRGITVRFREAWPYSVSYTLSHYK